MRLGSPSFPQCNSDNKTSKPCNVFFGVKPLTFSTHMHISKLMSLVVMVLESTKAEGGLSNVEAEYDKQKHFRHG